MINTPILISNNPTNLEKELNRYKNTITIEAEFGDICIKGTIKTLAHHGPRSNNPCPCIYKNNTGSYIIDAIGISHVDLDTLGGIMAVLGIKPDYTELHKKFWKTVEFIDLNGIHKIKTCPYINDEIMNLLDSFYAYSENHKIYPPKDGGVIDIRNEIEKYIDVIHTLLYETLENEKKFKLISNGKKWRKRMNQLNADSYITHKIIYNKSAVIRKSDKFVNHLYETPNGEICDICVGYNINRNSVTISYAEPIKNFKTCKEIVQEFWGEKAGGHATIAGSPRDLKVSEEEFNKFINWLTKVN